MNINTTSKSKVFIMFLALTIFLIYGCKEEETGPSPTGNQMQYSLSSVSNPNISGSATFIELSDYTTRVEISLGGTTGGNTHPAHIHNNNALEGGGIAISLEPIDGATGMSTTTISAKDDETAITYSELISFDGYINVHLSSDALGTLVAQGDVGGNALTSNSVEYVLNELNTSGVSGTAKFEERENGEALVTLTMTGTTEGGSHPAHIHSNDIATGGGVILTFNLVDGTTGIGQTNITELNDASPFVYADVLTVDGHIKVHTSPDDLSAVAGGDIGVNAN